MGFYGNITSTNKTQFTFDRIYPSRKVMDEALTKRYEDSDTFPGDGVFIGRFVLVDYEDGEISGYFPIYKKDDSGIFYADSSFNTIMTLDLCKANDIFQYQAGSMIELWQATGNSATITIEEEEIEYATFTQVTNSKYEANYKVDIDKYGPGRGYDGTVWQKVFADNAEKYVMIAELNSVVPTFKITADAPTMTPLAPHFDKQSNNVAYWLHWQPQWGMRVKEAPETGEVDKDGNPIRLSDEKVTWINSVYNEITHQVDPVTNNDVDGNIFYNKAGLSREKRSYYQLEDSISVTPTGVSGYKYQDHGKDPAEAPDIQEISIILPSIGNAISEAWDVVYGVPKGTDNKRNLDINWDSLKGIRMIEDGATGYKYDATNANSLAGCINSVHDLMGMIIMEESVADAKDADANSIYYNSTTGKFERKHTTYTYTEVSSVDDEFTYEEKPGANLLKWEPGKYYYKDSLGNYFADESEKPDLSRNYYNPNLTEQSLTPEYLPDTWWLKEGNDYKKAKSEEGLINAAYYNVDEGSIITAYWYTKGEYLYKQKEDDPYYLVTSEDVMNPNYIYYRLKKNGTYTYYKISELEEKEISYEAEPGKYITIKTKVIPDDAIYEQCNSLLVQFEQNKYYKKDYSGPDYTLLTSIPTNENDGTWAYVFAIKAEQIPPFYESDLYYFKSNKDYLKDRAGVYNEEKTYYKLNAENKIEKEFYVKGEYFEEIDGSYNPSIDSDPDSDKNYYEKKGYYVIEDELGELLVGMEWNSNIQSWPSTLHIGVREEQYEMQELPGFARSFNTIHGLILEIKKLLDTGHIYTRDISTVQGSINKLNDIIAKFEDLQPGKLVLIDDYGRVHPTDTIDNNWLKWEVNADPVTPSIEVIHQNAQTAVTKIAQINTTPNFGSQISTPKVEIDEKGHVSLLENENITLPKPSLTSNGSGVLTEMTLDDTIGAISAFYTNLSDIKLDGYTKTLDTGALIETDSLEIGLSKLENSISLSNEALEETALELEAADTALSDRIAINENKLTGISTTVNESITTAINGLANGQVKTNSDNIATEITNRTNADNVLSARIAEFETDGANDVWALDLRVQDNTAKITAIEDKFKESDIAEDGTTTIRTSGYMKWNIQDVAPTVTEGIPAIWMDTATGEIKLYNGSIWVILSATAVV